MTDARPTHLHGDGETSKTKKIKENNRTLTLKSQRFLSRRRDVWTCLTLKVKPADVCGRASVSVCSHLVVVLLSHWSAMHWHFFLVRYKPAMSIEITLTWDMKHSQCMEYTHTHVKTIKRRPSPPRTVSPPSSGPQPKSPQIWKRMAFN